MRTTGIRTSRDRTSGGPPVQFKVVLLYFQWQCGSGVMTQLDGRLRKILCLTIT